MGSLFRKEAIDNFSSNMENFKSVRAIEIKTLLFILLLLICTSIFAIWLFLGTVLETIRVDGIIWPVENKGTIYAEFEGSLSKLVVSEGNLLEAGDIVAIIPQEDILEKIASEKAEGVSDLELQMLYDEYDKKSIIRSNMGGLVTYIIDENSYVFPGSKLAVVAPYGDDRNNRTLAAFVPLRKSGLISLGMEVQVSPDFAPRDEYGYIKAYVSEISPYPVKGQHIKDSNSTLFLSSLDEDESYIQVQIMLLPDSTNASNLSWSRADSGNVDLAMGTICRVDIIIKKDRPFKWLFLGG